MTRYIRVLVFSFALALLPGAALADMDRAMELLEAGDFEGAFAELLPHAREGNPRAQTEIAILYLNGRGVEEDSEEALSWAREAANQSDPFGQYLLGWMLVNGHGTEPDAIAAIPLYEAAANRGLVAAQTALANLFTYGADGIEIDHTEGDYWYAQAVQNGDPQAMNGFAWSLVIRDQNLIDALNISETSVALEPGNAASIDTLGTIRLLLERYESAAKYLELAVALQPDYPPFMARLGDAYAGMGDDASARAQWEAAMSAVATYEGGYDELWDIDAVRDRLGL
ncbi:MAG: hypothetical protein AAF414_05130 [Pseudomonadota bacterium]